jgi:hypothetical protein
MIVPLKVSRSTMAAEAGVGESLCPAAETLVGGGDRVEFFSSPSVRNLKQHLGPVPAGPLAGLGQRCPLSVQPEPRANLVARRHPQVRHHSHAISLPPVTDGFR